jgi:hypothetical protein
VKAGGLDGEHHWQVYLPVLLVSFVLMVPAIIYGEKRGELKRVFVSAVALMLAAQIGLAFSMDICSGAWWRPVRLFRGLQYPGGQPAVADLEDRAARGQGHGHGRIQHIPGAWVILRRRGRRLAGAASWLRRGVRVLRRPHAVWLLLAARMTRRRA